MFIVGVIPTEYWFALIAGFSFHVIIRKLWVCLFRKASNYFKLRRLRKKDTPPTHPLDKPIIRHTDNPHKYFGKVNHRIKDTNVLITDIRGYYLAKNVWKVEIELAAIKQGKSTLYKETDIFRLQIV